MFIQTEETPNPHTLKFMPGKVLLERGTEQFNTPQDAARSPLAERLFRIDGVEGVFYGRDFLSVTKGPEKEWYVLKPPILGAIMEHFVAAQPLFYEQSDSKVAKTPSTPVPDGSIEAEIVELLETRVRPAVAMDGGDIVFEKFEDGVVYVTMKGACSGCPSSSATLKSGIENMLKYYIPEVQEVRPL